MVQSKDVELIQLAEMYEKGLPPISGGVLEQSQWFVSSARFVWRQKAEIEAFLLKQKD